MEYSETKHIQKKKWYELMGMQPKELLNWMIPSSTQKGLYSIVHRHTSFKIHVHLGCI